MDAGRGLRTAGWGHRRGVWLRAARIQGPGAQWRLADSVGSAQVQEPFNSSEVRSRCGQLYSGGPRFQAEIGRAGGARITGARAGFVLDSCDEPAGL